jgi:hypothetical protein
MQFLPVWVRISNSGSLAFCLIWPSTQSIISVKMETRRTFTNVSEAIFLACDVFIATIRRGIVSNGLPDTKWVGIVIITLVVLVEMAISFCYLENKWIQNLLGNINLTYASVSY